MEEINIFLDNKINIYYLSLFDNYFKDENYFKIGNYELIDQNNQLIVHFDDGKQENYNYLKTENNIKYFGDESNINQNKKKNISLSHIHWCDELILENNICYRISNNDKGKFILNNDILIIKWDNYNEEIFEYDPSDNIYKLINNDENNDKNNNNSIINTNNNEINNENKNLFKNNDQINELISKQSKNITVLVKNVSWENEIYLEESTQCCTRLNESNDKGHYEIENNYLTIYWDKWEKEIFYKETNHNYYINNNQYIQEKKFILSNTNESYYKIDKEYIYIDENTKYIYNLTNKKLHIENEKNDTFIYLDEEYYHIDFFNIFIIDQKEHLFFKNENIILNNNQIIIGRYHLLHDQKNVYSIKWYNETNKIYKKNNNNNQLIELISILLNENKNEIPKDDDNNIKKYYIIQNFLYNETFKHFVNFEYIHENEILIENSLIYKNINNIFVLQQENNQQEIILYENDYKFHNYYYNDNSLINTTSKYFCLIDDEKIHIKQNNKICIYQKLIKNIYVIDTNIEKLKYKTFNEDIYNYFDNKIENIDNELDLIDELNQNIIYNEETFLNFYVFLEKFDFSILNNLSIDIFKIYGFFIIEICKIIPENIEKTMNIINFKKNEDFIENQEYWINYLDKNKKDLILIFDDYSYYEFINDIFDFKNNFNNIVVIIDYTKCSMFIHYYINKLIEHIDKFNQIETIIYSINKKDKIKEIKQVELYIIEESFYTKIYSKIDMIIFMIYFYIKNRTKMDFDYNFKISNTKYKKMMIK